MKPWRTAGSGRGPIALALSATLIITAACTSSLKDDDTADSELGGLDEWPDLELVGEATSPVRPDVSVAVQPVVRTPDGLGTLTLEVDNRGNEDVTAENLFSFSENIPSIDVYDPSENVRYGPVAFRDDYDSGYCLCSSSDVTIPAGETRTLYATYQDLHEDVESVRVQMSRFTPIEDVPVEQADNFEVAAGQTTPMESDNDIQVAIDSVTRHQDGTLVSARYINEGSSEPVGLDVFPDPSALAVVSGNGDAVFVSQSEEETGDSAVAATNIADSEETLPQGGSLDVEVMTAPLPDSVESVFVRAPGMRRTLPVPVTEGDDDVPEPATFTMPRNLAEPVIHELTGPTDRFNSPMVPTTEADPPPVDVAGPELPEIDVTDTLTSDAQPGYSVAVRGVVRSPGDHSILLLDVTRGDDYPLWPQGVGLDGSDDDLGGITVIDREEALSYGVYTNEEGAFSAGSSWNPDREATLPGYAVLPALEPTTAEVDVDVPAFGTVEDVPVVDWPTEEAEGDGVAASMRVQGNANLRMDILTVSDLGDGNGTLVRARLVNESDPSAVQLPFAGENNMCDLGLYDQATGNWYGALQPCHATSWSTSLAQGEELVYEVQFPELPENVENVVVAGNGYLPSAPVAVADDELPWYLTFPTTDRDPQGTIMSARVGKVDRSATITEVEDMVEVVLEGEVFFDFDSDGLTDEGKDLITDLAADIADTARPGTVTITGHTDEIGSDDYNDGLSADRAEAVRAVLEEAVDRSDLDFEVEGLGSQEPVAPNEIDGRDNPDGRERNRRVEIVYEAQ